jgi:DNA-binding transcriptional MerR regulator
MHWIGLAPIMFSMRTLKTSEAATLLNVSPNTLHAWERHFGYPRAQPSEGRSRLYPHGEVAALRDALQHGLSISAAISRARQALGSDTHTLVAALAGFELDRADSAMESALALRPVERAIHEVLLPAVDEIGRRHGADSAHWAFAAHWAHGWLRRAQRLDPPPVRRLAILVGDAARNELDRDALAVRALELFCGRSGARVMALPVGGGPGLSDVVESLSPAAVVIAGGHLPDDDVALWAYRVRAAAGPLPMALFRRSHNGAKIRTTGTVSLSDIPWDAHRRLLALVGERQVARVQVAAPCVLAGGAERREAQA